MRLATCLRRFCRNRKVDVVREALAAHGIKQSFALPDLSDPIAPSGELGAAHEKDALPGFTRAGPMW